MTYIQKFLIFIKKILKIKNKRKKAEAVAQRCSIKKDVLKNFAKNHRKISVPESLLNKVAGWSPVTLLKRDSITDVFL